MKHIKVAVAAIALGFMSGCASMNAPSSSLIDEKPVIEIGDTSKSEKDHILLIPANKDIPVNVLIHGDIFAKKAELDTTVSLKEDLYLYQYWASRDGRHWIHSHEMFNFEVSSGLSKSGGTSTMQIDYAK